VTSYCQSFCGLPSLENTPVKKYIVVHLTDLLLVSIWSVELMDIDVNLKQSPGFPRVGNVVEMCCTIHRRDQPTSDTCKARTYGIIAREWLVMGTQDVDNT
jgi:hypothetical protein